MNFIAGSSHGLVTPESRSSSSGSVRVEGSAQARALSFPLFPSLFPLENGPRRKKDGQQDAKTARA